MTRGGATRLAPTGTHPGTRSRIAYMFAGEEVKSAGAMCVHRSYALMKACGATTTANVNRQPDPVPPDSLGSLSEADWCATRRIAGVGVALGSVV